MPLMPPPGMGSANPANLEALAASGDPRAIAILQQQQAAMQGGAGMPGGGVPPGQPGMAAPGGAQSPGNPLFQNSGQVPQDVQDRRTQQLIQLLRARGG